MITKVTFIFGALAFLYIVGLNMGRFFGHVEEWHDDCDLEAWGQLYNGRTTYYVFFVPVYRRGFYHSTTLDF